ncbi:DUF4179 domain-containing protein [Faecalimicrobium sp. JNUCC 81]
MSKFDEIKIPSNLSSITNSAIERADRDKKRKGHKKGFIVAASVCIICAGALGVGTLNPSLAESVPIVHDLFKELNNKLNLGYEKPNKIQGIGDTKTSNGVSLTIDEASSDGYSIYLTYTIKSEEKLPRNEQFKPYGEDSGFLDFDGVKRIKTKGIEMVTASSSGGYFKDNYTYVGIKKYGLHQGNKNIPKYIDLDLNISSIGIHSKNSYINGEWKFKLRVNTNDTIKNIKPKNTSNIYNVTNVGISSSNIVFDIEVPKEKYSDYSLNLDELLKVYLDDEQTLSSEGYKISEDKNRVTYRAVIVYNDYPGKNHPNKLIFEFDDKNKVEAFLND